MNEIMTISEVVRRSGVVASALRYYEERQLITSIRYGAGPRRFQRSVLRRIAFIVFAQKVGLSLEEIGTELNKLPTDTVPTGADWARLSEPWSERIDDKIAELKRLKVGLTQCISCGCLSLDSCALSNPDDRAGRLGPGPRAWVTR